MGMTTGSASAEAAASWFKKSSISPKRLLESAPSKTGVDRVDRVDLVDWLMILKLCKIDSNIHSYVDKIVEDYDIKKINYNSLLNIKYIHGVTLYDYLNHYKIIPIKKFIHLLELMIIFHEDIIKMNELHFYHKDIFSQNVMINFKLDKLFLIDFGRSKYRKKKKILILIILIKC